MLPLFSLPRRLIVCADDYAISPGVSAGIRELAEAGRISATGVMTCMPSWPAEAPALRELDGHVAVGLHFTLTGQRPLGAMPTLAPAGRFPTARDITQGSFLGRLPADEIAAELERQLDAFEAHFGRAPDFIDGHQHVHQLRGVREAVLGAFGRRLDPARAWLRDTTDGLARLFRRGSVEGAIVAALGRALHRAAVRRGIAMNSGFSGFYDYARAVPDAALPRALEGAGDGHLLMVHPGHPDDALAAVDPLLEPRAREWAWLMGDAFPHLLAARRFVLAKSPGNAG